MSLYKPPNLRNPKPSMLDLTLDECLEHSVEDWEMRCDACGHECVMFGWTAVKLCPECRGPLTYVRPTGRTG